MSRVNLTIKFKSGLYVMEYDIKPPPWRKHRPIDPTPEFHISGATEYKRVGFLDNVEILPTEMPLGGSFFYPMLGYGPKQKEKFDADVKHQVTNELEKNGHQVFQTKSCWKKDDPIYPGVLGTRIWRVGLLIKKLPPVVGIAPPLRYRPGA